MLTMLSNAIRMATLVLVLSSSTAVMAAPLVSHEGQIQMTSDDATYQNVHAEVTEKMNKLEELGGGMKPLKNYLKQIDNTYAKGNEETAMKQITSFNNSVEQQLKKVKELRSRKRVVKQTANPVPQAPGMEVAPTKEPVTVLLDALSKAKRQTRNTSSSKLAKFNGTPNAYLQMVVKDIVSRELGGIQLPCKAPFRLERFRIAQRISALQKQGQDVRNYVAYYNRTEAIARSTRNNPRRIPELNSNVRYLSQQLNLAPLTGSLNTRIFR